MLKNKRVKKKTLKNSNRNNVNSIDNNNHSAIDISRGNNKVDSRR